MKIYTEIQYKWLDDQLVRTSAKSFEYYGRLSLCEGSGGGGGVVTDALDTITAPLEDVAGGVTDTATDIVDTTTGVVTDVLDSAFGKPESIIAPSNWNPGIKPPPVLPWNNLLDTATDVAETVVDTATDVAEGAVEGAETIVEEAVNTTEAATEVVAETGDVILDGAEDVLDATTEGLNTGLDVVTAGIDETVGEFGTELADAITPGGTTKDLLDKLQDTLDDATTGITTTLDDALGLGETGGPGPVELDKLKVHKGRLKNKNKANLAVNKSKGRARKSLKIQRTA